MNLTNFSTAEPALAAMPCGFTARAATMTDIPAVVTLINSVSRIQEGREITSEVLLESEWTNPTMTIASSTRLVFSADGALVGYMEIMDNVPERVTIWGCVHIGFTGLGIGTYLMQWAEAHTRALIPRAQPDAQVVLRAFHHHGEHATEKLFTDLGYEPIRYSRRMLVEPATAPEAPPLPPGFALRTYHHPQDLELVVQTFLDTFQDHWGFVARSFDEVREEWRHNIETDPLFDPSLWLLAVEMESNEIAGMALNRIEAYDDADSAYVETLGVRRAYRKHGLGYTLLMNSLRALYDKSARRVSLHVDSGSLTGAFRLYERAGMHLDQMTAIYLKELRPGKAVMTTSL